MTHIARLTVQTADLDASRTFWSALGLDHLVDVAHTDEPSTGFRGFTVSLIVAGPATALALVDAATAAGGTVLKPATRSFWGFGGVVADPDGTIVKIASSSKKDTGPATRDIDSVVVLLGCDDVAATRQFYVDHGLTVGKSFGKKYVEFTTDGSPVGLGLYGRRALAKDAGVPADGTGSHRIVIGGDAGDLTDPEGFRWHTATVSGKA
ncbi:MAG: glyoxalase [Pseudonocardia sp.]|uniref:glyoxalase n=1 Tax=unclassified Pseudonocardia TaxID=2619320 RepID=UPI000868A2C0|nr:MULTISPECIES: glyoxalase [unclassified Pseudonocardia]MBN9113602.1 glyoxalase [Pseudonocardia sp.]ODU25176.1 MAG: glyoxalase [Pseudonocardia sp. SCN 72-51]ODV00049.1 MAG: glyoxalase [Pseudonocardia sp. SCN 73-27]